MIANLSKFIGKAKVWLMGMWSMEKLSLSMMKAIRVCIMRINHHSRRYSVELILKYGKYYKWIYSKENRAKV